MQAAVATYAPGAAYSHNQSLAACGLIRTRRCPQRSKHPTVSTRPQADVATTERAETGKAHEIGCGVCIRCKKRLGRIATEIDPPGSRHIAGAGALAPQPVTHGNAWVLNPRRSRQPASNHITGHRTARIDCQVPAHLWKPGLIQAIAATIDPFFIVTASAAQYRTIVRQPTARQVVTWVDIVGLGAGGVHAER
ncbi:hypothetical protein D3C73_361360 [compost metagenome]